MLAAQSDRVATALARGDRCDADRLADELVAQAETASLPADYRRPLLAAARSLAADVECPPPPAPAPLQEEDEGGDDEEEDTDEEEDGKGEGRGNGKGKGKGKGRG